MDDLADQVQSLFYHDIHFNAINMWMHTKCKCEMPHGLKTNKMFKIDTGADGNLMPITMFVRLFPKLSLETFEKTVEKGVTLFAYNNTPTRALLGHAVLRLSFKGKVSNLANFTLLNTCHHNIGNSIDSEKIRSS